MYIYLDTFGGMKIQLYYIIYVDGHHQGKFRPIFQQSNHSKENHSA